MAVAYNIERSVPEPIEKEKVVEDQTLNILQSARYALRWNTPGIAAVLLLKNRERIAQLKDRIGLGSPTEKAETRHLLAKAGEQVTRLRRLGLANGTDEERSPGMIFAVPSEIKKVEGEPTSIFEWWYLPREQIEEAIDLSFRDRAEPNIDSYVLRASMGFVASEADRRSRSHQIYSVSIVNQDPKAASKLLEVAQHMKNNNLYGKIPSRRENLMREILYSGAFPVYVPDAGSSDNLSNLSATSPTPNRSRAKIA